MAISVVNTQTTSTSASSITITKPTGVTTGDLMVATLLHDFISTSAFSCTGWVQQCFTASNIRHGLLTRIVDGSEGANFTFTATGADTQNFNGMITAYRADSGTINIDTASSNNGDGSATIATTALTPVDGGTLVCSFSNDSLGSVSSAPSGMTSTHAVIGSGQALIDYYQLGMAASSVSKSITWSITEQLGANALTFHEVSSSTAVKDIIGQGFIPFAR